MGSCSDSLARDYCLDYRGNAVGKRCGRGRSHLAVQEEERKAMDRRPKRGAQRVGVCFREVAPGDRTDHIREGRTGVTVMRCAIAWLSAHHAEQRRAFKRELDICD